MTGLIWLVQVVHYPYFRFIGPDLFKDAQEFHMKSITFIVLPIMILELGTGVWLFFQKSLPPEKNLYIVSFILLILIWGFTHFLSVPIHGKLTEAKNIEIINKLVQTNWLRTILWSIRSGILGIIVWQILRVKSL